MYCIAGNFRQEFNFANFVKAIFLTKLTKIFLNHKCIQVYNNTADLWRNGDPDEPPDTNFWRIFSLAKFSCYTVRINACELRFLSRKLSAVGVKQTLKFTFTWNVKSVIRSFVISVFQKKTPLQQIATLNTLLLCTFGWCVMYSSMSERQKDFACKPNIFILLIDQRYCRFWLPKPNFTPLPPPPPR